MSRVVIDITELKNWSGHLTGVQRVVYGLATELAKNSDDVAFCSFDSTNKVFVEDSIRPYIAQVSQSAPLQLPKSRRDLVRGAVTKAYFSLPHSFRAKLSEERKRQLKKAAKRSYALAQNVAVKTGRLGRRAENKLGKQTHIEAMSLGPEDTLLIPGRLWDYPDCIEYIMFRKHQDGFKLATVIYDLVPIYQRHTFGPGLTERYAPYLFQTIYYSDILLPISKSTQNDIGRFADELGLELPRIEVIRLGDDLPYESAQKPNINLNLEDGFGICIGTIEARKNHMLIYYAYKLAVQEGHELPPLVIVGKEGWLTHETVYFIKNDPETSDKIIIVPSVTDSELGWLYENALFSVYPSQYEGWGLPIAESMVYGTPCIASNTSSMVEIAPELVDHVSPFDSRALMGKMQHYANRITSEKRRAEIQSKYKAYSWSQTAKQLKKYLS